MKKTWMVIAITLITLNLSATNLLTEDFEYAQGDLLTDNGWFTQYFSASAISVTNGLDFDGYAGCGIGNAAVIDISEGAQLHKTFTQVTEGSVYMAFMFQPVQAYKEGYFLMFRDEKLDATNFNFNARLFINTESQLGFTFADNGKKEYNPKVLDAATTYLVVIKYTVNAGANNDAASLYLLESFSETEPTVPFIGPLTDDKKNDINPANIVLRAFSADNWLVLDGIRVGTTWEDAVKSGACASSIRPTIADNHKLYVKNSQVHFEVTETNSLMSVYDVTGRCLKQEIVKEGQHAISLAKGAYILQINNSTQKFIID